jgi:ABC-type sugar transport system substrate-binding protein
MSKNFFYLLNLNKYICMQIILSMLITMCIVMMIPAQIFAENKPLKFAFFNIATPEDYWWNNASRIMQAACEDFGIELDLYYANRNQFLMIRQFQQVVNDSPRVNGVIFSNMKQNIVQMLQIAEKAKIPAFVFNAGLTENEIKKYGGPRKIFSYWIGQILPSDEQAGYDLAKKLFAQAKKNGLADAEGKLHVIGIGGTISDIAAIEREKGLIKAVKEDPQVMLHQIVPASWERERGRAVFLGLKSRYPDVKVVWAANDPMGLGVIAGIKSLKLEPGKDILVGSIDWIPDALEAVRRGELTVSIGGHFLESAWSVVLLYDYFNGNDFSKESVEFTSRMEILTPKNIENYPEFFEDGNWGKVDFKKFSKTTFPHLKVYNFTFDAIIEQVSQ